MPYSHRDFFVAFGAHVLVSPLWLIMSIAGAELPLSQGPLAGVAAVIWLVALLGGWLWLGIMLLVWARAGRGPVWSYPLRWALALSFTFLTLFALLVPRVRRWLVPPPASVSLRHTLS